MKNNSLVGESIISILLVGLLLLCWNPGKSIWMPSMGMSMVLLILVIVFMVFAAFVWKERARDEREEQHRLVSGRVSFLCGALMLLIGIVAESYRGTPDPWLLAALGSMVIAKLSTRVYGQIKW